MSFCLPKENVEKFINALKTGAIDPGKLSQLDSSGRRKFFSDLVGETDARDVNALFESKLLLKNQQTGMINWAKQVTGIKEATRRDLLSKIERMDKVLNAAEEKAFLEDLADKKLGFDVTYEEAKSISDLSKKISDTKTNMEGTVWKSPERRAYGNEVVKFTKLIEELKNPDNKLGFVATVKKIAGDTAGRFSKENGVLGNTLAALKLMKDVTTTAIYKSIQASADISYSLRQGYKVLTTNPKVWKENWVKAFEPFKKITSQEAMQQVKDGWMADIVSHPLYDKAIQGKLALGVAEEFFPTTLAEKIPGLGNVFKASNEAFTIFSQGSRLGLFEDMYKIGVENGSTITPQFLKDISSVANSITGRGSLGPLERNADLVNKVFYSGRYISSAIDTFTMPFKQSLDSVARSYAMKSSIRTIGTITAVMYTASLFTDVEMNPLSSKFGKAKVPGSKDTWVDLTAGLGSYIHTATSLALFKTKNSKTGKIQELNKRDKKGNIVYGGQTGFDLGVNFLVGKLAPAPSAVVQYAKGRTYTGEKPTPLNTARNLATPISIGNAWQEMTSDDDNIAKLISSVADIFGMNSSNYSNKK